jgi:seryl-tRNA synthetase
VVLVGEGHQIEEYEVDNAITVYAVVTEDYQTDGIPAMFRDKAEAETYAQELNSSGVETETYIVADTTIM